MSVFATALATLHRDANIAAAAEFRRPPGAWVALRVILSQPTDDVGQAIAGRLQADIAGADLPYAPVPGDELKLGATTYRIDEPRQDAEGLTWRVALSEP